MPPAVHGRRGHGDRRSPRQHRRPGRGGRRREGGVGQQPSQHLAAVGRPAQPDRPRRPCGDQRAGLGYRHPYAAAYRRRPVQCDPRVAAAVRAGDPRRRQPRTVPAVPAPIGAVVESHGLESNSANGMLYYAVLPDGLQPISPVLAAILRNANSYGLDQPPRLGADKVAKLPVSRQLDTSRYPEQRISLLDAAHDPVTCAHWSKPAGASTNSLTLLAGSALPIPDAVHTEDLVGAGAGGTASRVAMAPGTGYFAQTVGQSAASPVAGSLFWISDTGVRYGIDNEAAQGGVTGNAKTAEALGLSQPPTPIPWSILSLYAPGPTLSRADALLAHDGLAPDSRPGRTVSRRAKPMSRLDLRGTPPAAVTGDPQGQHQHRSAAGTAAGDSAVVAAAGAAGGDRAADRRDDRRDGRHRHATHLSADAVLPIRAAAGRHGVLPRRRQQVAHRRSRRRARRLPALPVGGPGQHPGPGRRATRRGRMVAPGTGGSGRHPRVATAVGTRPAGRRLPGGACRRALGGVGHRAAGQRHR